MYMIVVNKLIVYNDLIFNRDVTSFHLIVVRGFEYARDPESYTSGSVATGRACLAGQVKG
jgi:hypothetical protein